MSAIVKRRKDYQPPAFLISNVDLTFHLEAIKTEVVSIIKVTRNGLHTQPLVLDGKNLTLISLKLNGKAIQNYDLTLESLCIPDVPDTFTLEVTTQIDPQNNKALEGLYLFGNTYCTQCEAQGFRRITYFLDRPDVLSTYTVTIHGQIETQPTLLSNGNLIGSGSNTDGTHWVTWQDPHPKPCYLFALVAGEFDCLRDHYKTTSQRDVSLELYVDKGQMHRGRFALESLKRAMRWDEETYGLEYDLERYMVVAVDFFNMGAMENKGLNIFNSKFVLADSASATDDDFFNVESVIAHEYFHNWTGNRVTCRDWFQLSLKEGLTVFRDQQFSADMTSALSTRIKQVRVMREHQFAEDASAMSHPIRPDEVIEMNNFYTVTVYDKGAEVIRMLHTLLGPRAFRDGMDEYFRRHDGQAVTCDDFVAAMQAVTPLDLTLFSRWYSQSGTPVVTVKKTQSSSGQWEITLSQHTMPTADQSEKKPLLLPIGIELLSSDGRKLSDSSNLIQQDMLLLEQAQCSFEVKEQSDNVIPVVLSNFSAPAKVHNPLNITELTTVLRFASDPFNRWDASQTLYDLCIERIQNGEQPDEHVWPALSDMITQEIDNFELLGECLVIPSVEALCQSRNTIDIQALCAARNAFCEQFSNALHRELHSLYERCATSRYQYTQLDVQKRRCRNVALAHLARVPQYHSIVSSQFSLSDNMTDTLGALHASQHCDRKMFNALMTEFEQKWQSEPLVLDKWFSLHALQTGSNVLATLDMLRKHPVFSDENPNRVRALVGSFAFYNNECFHATDGTGYRYLTDYLLKLDECNPQVAARIVTPLTQWQRYSKPYQALMKVQLGRLLNKPGLSKDVFEKVSKSLAYEC